MANPEMLCLTYLMNRFFLAATVIVGVLCFCLFVLSSISKQKAALADIEGLLLSSGEHNDIIIGEPPKITRIGIFVVALGNYVNFTHNLVATGRKYLFTGVPSPQFYKITYFIYTNRVSEAPKGDDVVVIYQKRLGWPNDSMLRPEMYLNSTDTFEQADLDYMYNIDADIFFGGHVGPEILADLVSVWHHFHFTDPRPKYPFEKNNESCTYVPDDRGSLYYSGAVYGGKREDMMLLWQFMSECCRKDMSKGLTPIYHDESNLNHYLVMVRPPQTVLTPSYYCGDGDFCSFPYEHKLLFIIKDVDKAREADDDPKP